MAKRITMDDIALELNISKSIVSRALADKYGVGEETRNKIKLAALKMGYKFSKSNGIYFPKAENITVLVERFDLLYSDFWVKVINGIEKELNKKNISMYLSIIENNDEVEENDQDQMPTSIKKMKTDGVIILGRIPLNKVISVCTTGIPVVLIDTFHPSLKFDYVTINNYFGEYEVTEFVLSNGHTKIGFVGATSYSFSFKERFRGFVDCINERKDPDIKAFYVTDDYDDFKTPFSKRQLESVLLQNDKPTALICGNDPVAFHVYEILEKMGLKVPCDVSVIGFDNIQKCEWVLPALTTVSISKTVLAEKAVELVLKRVEDPDKSIEFVMLGTTIKKRNSVKNLKDKYTSI